MIGGEQPRVSFATREIDVPRLSKVEASVGGDTRQFPSVASILFVREVKELPAEASQDPESPYAAFRLGPLQLVPYFGRERSPEEAITFFYLVYDLKTRPGSRQADGVVAFRILKDGRPMARAPENPCLTPMAASFVGPVPLASFAPGTYVAELTVTDRVSGEIAVQREEFRIAASP